MELTEKDIEQIEQYWNGEALTDSERADIEQRFQTEPLFKKEAYKLRLLMQGLKVLEYRKLEKQTAGNVSEQEINVPVIPMPPPIPDSVPIYERLYDWVRPYFPYILGTAAAVLIGWGIWRFCLEGNIVMPSKLSPLVAANFEPYDDTKTSRGGTIDKAMEVYNQKRYKKSIPLFDQAFEIEKDSIILFYKGTAYLGNGETAQAITIFQNLINKKGVPQDALHYYLALAYLDSKQQDKAIILLNRLSNDVGKYKVKAEYILKNK